MGGSPTSTAGIGDILLRAAGEGTARQRGGGGGERAQTMQEKAMTETHGGGSDCGAVVYQGGTAAARGAADWLCLAAAPTFAIMALLTGVVGGGRMAMCSPLADAWPIGGMVPMYLLMSAFHSASWLKLISGRSGGARAPARETELSLPGRPSNVNAASYAPSAALAADRAPYTPW
jgi:hypothetical protein